MTISKQQHIHFIGIGGTAMGSSAIALHRAGFQISGSDHKMYQPMLGQLQQSGVTFYEGFSATHINEQVDIVVIGNAVSRGNVEVEACLNQKKIYFSLAELLKRTVLQNHRNIVVTGTHGKTTTSFLTAHLLKYNNLNPSYMIGGVSLDFGAGAYFSDGAWCVSEGDEYDTAFFDKRSKFLHYLPELVIINNIEFDHADIYQNITQIQYMFQRLLHIVPANGKVLINGDDENCRQVIAQLPFNLPITTVGLTANNKQLIVIDKTSHQGTSFWLNDKLYTIPLYGECNVRNAAMAILAAQYTGISNSSIQEALYNFQGVKRRQDLVGEAHGIKIIDDFAHHPTAIKEAIQAVTAKFQSQRIWTIFEPRSNTTKRNIFQQQLVDCFAAANQVVIAQPDQVKIVAEERLNVAQLAADIQQKTPCFVGKSVADIIDFVVPAVKSGDIILVLSNGGFDNIHQRLLTAIKNNH